MEYIGGMHACMWSCRWPPPKWRWRNGGWAHGVATVGLVHGMQHAAAALVGQWTYTVASARIGRWWVCLVLYIYGERTKWWVFFIFLAASEEGGQSVVPQQVAANNQPCILSHCTVLCAAQHMCCVYKNSLVRPCLATSAAHHVSSMSTRSSIWALFTSLML